MMNEKDKKLSTQENDELGMMNAESGSKSNSSLSTHNSSFNIPAIRFKGFNEEWLASELGEILDITSAARVHKEEWTDVGVPFFRTSDVVSIHKGLENKKAFISFDLYKELSTKSGSVKKDDLLITGGGL